MHILTQYTPSHNTAGLDYMAISSQMIVFQPGQASQTVSVTTQPDQLAEDAEQFTAVLTNPSSGANIGDDIATVTINDDSAVIVSLSPLAMANEADGMVVFTITRETETTRTIAVLFSTADISAVAGE